MFHGELLDGALDQFEPPSGGLVGDGHDARDMVFLFDQGAEGSHREFGRAHIDDARLLEEGHNLALEFIPFRFETVAAQQG